MEEQTSKLFDELAVDVIDYMFVEWLCRNSLYSKFCVNLLRHNSDSKEPRSIIRDQIRLILDIPAYSLEDLISSSFPFRCTPEGFCFWGRKSAQWASYLRSFLRII